MMTKTLMLYNTSTGREAMRITETRLEQGCAQYVLSGLFGNKIGELLPIKRHVEYILAMKRGLTRVI